MKEKSFDFAVRIVNLYTYLIKQKHETIMSKQLLRSGTAIGALVRQAQNGESTADFIHKLSIAQKECDETAYWLELLFKTHFLDEQQFQSMHNDANALLKIIRSAIITTKTKAKTTHNL